MDIKHLFIRSFEMKKLLLTVLIASAIMCGAFAKKAKVEPFKFDFSKDFYPGFAYVVENSKHFDKQTNIEKLDIIGNEYIVHNVSTAQLMVTPVRLSLKLKLQDDGSLLYEYYDIKYQDSKTNSWKETTLSKSINTKSIEQDFDELLPKCFGNEEIYNKQKSEFFNSPGLLYSMTTKLTEIRFEKFAQMVKDTLISMEAQVEKAQINKNKNMSDYKYTIAAKVDVGPIIGLGLHFFYYTNNDDKASLATGDKVKVEGVIKNYGIDTDFENRINNFTGFTVADTQQ